MAQTKPKAAQFYGVSGDGTAGQVLISDGNGGMFWGANTELFTVSWATPTGQGLTYTQPSPQSSEGTAGSAFPTTTFTATKSGEEISGTATIAGLPTGITATQSLSGSGVDNILTVTLAGVFPGADSLNTALTISGLAVSAPLTVDYLVVAGGGGGGYQNAGGGGAGGFLSSTISPIFGGTTLTITIGGGAAGGIKVPVAVNSGSDTTIAYGATTIRSIGGGGGSSDNNGIPAADGGSGGGGAAGSGIRTGGSGTLGQGNDGGDGSGSLNQGGGGGGAGATGQDANSSGANGGVGSTTTIISTSNATTSSIGEVSGSDLYFSGGGGGDNRTVFGSGGLGGGTNAAASPIDAGANTGGGGGSAFNGSPVRGANGGSGVVILKMLTADYSGSTTGLPDVYTEGSNTVLVFKTSGSYTT